MTTHFRKMSIKDCTTTQEVAEDMQHQLKHGEKDVLNALNMGQIKQMTSKSSIESRI
jgi:hypothetical protein